MTRRGSHGPCKGYIRDFPAMIGGEAGLTAAVVQLAVKDGDWDWLFGRKGNREARDFWLEAIEIETARFERLVAGIRR